MLTIQNIRDLSGTGGILFGWESRGWQFAQAFEDTNREWMRNPHYTITFNNGPYGGAIVIEREASIWDSKYYKVIVCYDEYPNVIHEGMVNIMVVKDRNRFFEWGIDILDAEIAKKRVC
jgi:hypothetical protein